QSKIQNQKSLRSLRLVVRRGLGAQVAQDGFAAEANLVALDGNHLDLNLVAFLELLADVRDAVFGHFADVEQAVRAGENLDEGAEIRQPDHFPEVGLAELRFGHQVPNYLQRLVGGFLFGGGDVHAPVVLDVALDAGLLDDAADRFAARPDQLADLRRIHAHEKNWRRVGG